MTLLKRPVLAGNWKMHHGPSATAVFFREFLALYPERTDRSIVFFPPASRWRRRERPSVLAPTSGWAYRTLLGGERRLHRPDLCGDGAGRRRHASLVGHSERRHLFGESVPDTVRKVAAVLAAGLDPVPCVGDLIEERRAGRAEAVVFGQLDPVLRELDGPARSRLLIAYEPFGDRHRRDRNARGCTTDARRIRERLGGAWVTGLRPRADSLWRQRETRERARIARATERGRRAGRWGKPCGRRIRPNLGRRSLTVPA